MHLYRLLLIRQLAHDEPLESTVSPSVVCKPVEQGILVEAVNTQFAI